MAGIRRVSDLGTRGWSNILDGSIVTADLANSSVTTAKIADNNIIQAKLDPAIPLSGMRNTIINGSFDIWQRLSASSLTFTPTANLTNYNSADRWFFGQNPTVGSLTVSRVASDNSQFTNGLRFGRADGATGAANGQVYLGQAIETLNSRRFAGQTATLSFWVKRNTAGGATIPTNLNVRVFAGQGTDQSSFTWMTTGWTGQSTVLDQVVSTTGTMTRYSYSFSVPSTTRQLLLHYFYTPATSPASGEWFQIEGVQLEVGSQVTPFEHRLYGTELNLCQRYYEFSNGVTQVVGGSTGFGGNTYWSWTPYVVEKRIALNYTTDSAANGIRISDTAGTFNQMTYWRAATQYTATNIGFEVWTTKGFGLVFNGGQTDSGLGRFNWFANAEL